MSFKEGFVWGAATAAYQVEGAAFEDGKGLNIWDVYSHEEGKIYGNHNGDIACDQYHKYKEDMKLMKDLGIQAYRFSINWARILPDGTGKINQKGIDYYNALIDEIIANHMEPYMTIHHWDLPYALYQKGGWMNPDSPDWFYEFSSILAQNFSDRVKYFITFNEPQCIVGLGYMTGEHAPGLRTGKRDYFHMFHHILLAHGKAVQALRENARQKVQIGIAPCGAIYYPATEKEEDIEAARKATFHLQTDDINECIWNFSLFTDPIFKGKYPEEVLKYYGKYLPEITKEDMELISQPIDFYGQNIYNAVEVKASKSGEVIRVNRKEGAAKTAIQWPVTPKCLYYGPKFIYERYKKPFYITENGMSSHDWISLDGKVHDGARVDFMHRYLKELNKAADSGVDIAGYFAWSIMDNYEWAYGYSERFGMIYVDYETQERTPKDSAYFYKKVAESNGACL